MNKLRSAIIIAILGATTTVSADDLAQLTERHRQWLLEDVRYIITKQDKGIFLGLQTERERDVFIENFWKKLDPVPITPQNEFKEEHYQRLDYAREHYGLNTDQGRIWILLGKPEKIFARPVDNSFYAMEHWDYTRLRVPGLPPDLRLIFYKKWGVGYYILYSPLFDTVRSLLVNRMLDPDDRKVQKWLMANMDFGIRQATTSVSTGLDAFQSQDIIARLSWSYGELLDRFHKNRVEAKVVFEGEKLMNPSVEMSFFPTISGHAALDAAIEIPPQDMTFEQVGQSFVARVDIYIKLLDAQNRAIDDARESLTIELTKEQLDASATYPLLYLARFPVIPGSYAIEVLARDFSSGRVGRIRQSVTVEPPPSDKLWASPLVIAYKLERPDAANDGGAFNRNNHKLYPRVGSVFGVGANIYFATEIRRPVESGLQAGDLPLKYVIAQAGKPVREYPGKAEFAQGSASAFVAEGFSAEGVPPGDYVFRVVVPDPAGDVTLTDHPFSLDQAPRTNARFLFQQGESGEAREHLALGTEYLYRGNPAEAAMHFGLAHDHAPWMAAAAVNLARANVLLGKHEAALAALAELLADDPNNADALMIRCQALIKAGKPADARQVLERLLAIEPNNTIVLNYCAETYMGLAEKDRGIELFKKSLELNPDQPDVAAIIN